MRVRPLVVAMLLACLIAGQGCFAESVQVDTTIETDRISLRSFILPALLIGYGVVGIESDDLKLYNSNIKEEVNEHIDRKFTIDDVSQYVPFTAVYVLSASGVESEHGFKERTCILGAAYVMMGAAVLGLKRVIDVERPDKTTRNSFPSGHTATAFMGAEFMHQEYKDVSIWYGISAYVIAVGTGAFRMYNDRHWLTDVAAGAGFGILSTRLAYILHDRWKVFDNCRLAPAVGDNAFGFRFSVDY